MPGCVHPHQPMSSLPIHRSPHTIAWLESNNRTQTVPDLIILLRNLHNLSIIQESSIRGDSSTSRVEQSLVKNDTLTINRDYFPLKLTIVGSVPEEFLGHSLRRFTSFTSSIYWCKSASVSRHRRFGK